MKDFAPILAGTPPAFILAVQLYKSVAQALGIVGVSFWSVFPGLLAAAGMAGMIWVELQTYKTAARAFALRERGPFIVATLGALTLSGFVVFAVYIGAETKSLATSTAGMIIGYLVIAVNVYMNERKEKAAKTHAEAIEATSAQIALVRAQAEAQALVAQAEAERLRQEKNLTNAQTRAAKVEVDPEGKNGKNTETFRDWRKLSESERSDVERMTTAEIMVHFGVSDRTARNWKNRALEQIKAQ